MELEETLHDFVSFKWQHCMRLLKAVNNTVMNAYTSFFGGGGDAVITAKNKIK